MSSKNVVKHQAPEQEVIPFDETPAYLPTTVKDTGFFNLDKDDYKTPRILLLQGLSPQIQNFHGSARAGHFWHTGLNVPLGDEFKFIPCNLNKKVILWRPRHDQGGGILAFSSDACTWDTGGNMKHRVIIDEKGTEVIWDTGKDVRSSGLSKWGSYDPDSPESGPAAQIIYEYLCYLPHHPNLSPCVMGLQRTGLANGKSFNTSLYMKKKEGKPIYSVVVDCFSEEKADGRNKWTVPHFRLAGWAPENWYEAAKKIAEEYSNYQVDYEQEGGQEPIIDDKIAY